MCISNLFLSLFFSLHCLVSDSLTDFCLSAMLILFQEVHIWLSQKVYLERCSYLLSFCQDLLEEKNAATDNWKPSICLWRRQCNTKESRRERFLYFIYHFVSKCCFVKWRNWVRKDRCIFTEVCLSQCIFV